MESFEVGDRVRLLGDWWPRHYSIPTGTEVTITRTDGDGIAYFQWDQMEFYVSRAYPGVKVGFIGLLVERGRRPLKVGDHVRLTGGYWRNDMKGEIYPISKVLSGDDEFEAQFETLDTGWWTTSRVMTPGDTDSEQSYRDWGCELVEEDERFEHQVGAVSIRADLSNQGKVFLRAHTAHDGVVTAVMLTDEELDELTTVLLYVKMERDKLKE